MGDMKVDLRIKRTQHALVIAMLKLLEQESFKKITVNDLCTEAMVSRSAFYAHFEDKYGLLKFCMETLKNQLFEESCGLNLEERIYGILDRVQEHVAVFKNLMMAELDMELVEMMRQSFQVDFEELIAAKKQQGREIPDPSEIASAYYASGITSAIMLWVARDMSYSKETMVECLLALLPDMFHEMSG